MPAGKNGMTTFGRKGENSSLLFMSAFAGFLLEGAEKSWLYKGKSPQEPLCTAPAGLLERLVNQLLSCELFCLGQMLFGGCVLHEAQGVQADEAGCIVVVVAAVLKGGEVLVEEGEGGGAA